MYILCTLKKKKKALYLEFTILLLKENMIRQDTNWEFKYRIKPK